MPSLLMGNSSGKKFVPPGAILSFKSRPIFRSVCRGKQTGSHKSWSLCKNGRKHGGVHFNINISLSTLDYKSKPIACP